MSFAHPMKTNFTSGELTPRMKGRPDLEKRSNGAETILNFRVFPHGGITRREGTFYVREVKDSSAATRLVRFEFSVIQAYVLEFGNNYIRFFRDLDQVFDLSDTISGATQTNPVVITATGHGFTNGDQVIIDSVVGMTELNGRRFTVANAGVNDFELSGIDGTGYTAYSSGGTAYRPYEIATSYSTSELGELKFVQSADVLYVCHPDHMPRKISRTGHTSWTITDIDPQDGPYLPQNEAGGTTVTPAAVTGATTFSASANLWASTDVGRVMRWRNGTNDWGWFEITSYTDAQNIGGTWQVDPGGAAAASDKWRFGSWSDTTGWPYAATFHDQRLTFLGNDNQPQTVWASNSADFENFAPSAVDDTVDEANAFTYTISTDTVNACRWGLSVSQDLLIGTAGGEHKMDSGSTVDPLGPNNVRVLRQSTYGSAAEVMPVLIGHRVVFLQRARRKVIETAYDFNLNGFRGSDITILSEHITKGGVTRLAYAQDPDKVIYGVRADGVLLSCTRDDEQGVTAWTRNIIGGSFGSGNAVVEDVAVIPATDGTADEVWLIVKRTIDGTTRRYVEVISSEFDQDTLIEDAVFVDSALTYDGSATDTFAGLWHLEGETLQVLGDGSVQPDVTVVDGAVTITTAAAKVSLGLEYSSDLLTVEPEAGAQLGTAQGFAKRINKVKLRFYRSLGGYVGPALDTLDELFGTKVMDGARTLVTGDRELIPTSNWGKGQIAVRQNYPLPMTLLGIMPELKTSE